MRTYCMCLFVFSVLFIPASSQEKISDEQFLASLEQRAGEAPEREQCYLYSELIRQTVEYGARQYASGEVDKATTSLKRTQHFAEKIRRSLGNNAKKLKRSQILLRRAAFRLTDLLHVSSYEHRELVQETLTKVERTERETMMQVFRK